MMSRSEELARRFFSVKVLAPLLAAVLLIDVVIYKWLVVWRPGEHMRRDHILSLMSRESPVYYNDAQVLLGTFFAQEHRRFVTYDEMPKCLVDAIVAAEDARFFEHGGFSLRAIVRAALANLWASVRSFRIRIVQGGSTLTQQTAKNLFKRKDRSLPEKLKELLNALRLEAHYSKQEILEFYLNQFYVNANGRGVGIAAQYFFDKDVSELDLVECAFIAGSVKGPDYYNPAIQPTPEKAQKARERAEARKNYVLRRMRDAGLIAPDEYESAAAAPVPFHVGRFRFPRSVVLDLVEREIESPEIRAVLEAHGIGDVNTAGLRIITTLDADVQEAALGALRKNLSELKLQLEGYHAPDEAAGREEEDDLSAGRVFRLARKQFYRGRIDEIVPEVPRLWVRFGAVEGIVDAEGLRACVRPLEEGRRGFWYEAKPKDTAAFMKTLREGALFYVRVREEANGKRPALLDCMVEPGPEEPLQGGIVVLERGRYRALVGGVHNTNFDRATTALRQPGSAFKPVVYLAALSLGWAITDPLPNDRELFEFEQTFYFPKPDHGGAPSEVTLAWAGAKSENVASVWLLYHLLDKLSDEQAADLAERVGLAPRDGESAADYARRIRDKEGVLLNDRVLEEAAFEAARDELARDWVFEGKIAEASLLRELHYGVGFEERLAENLKELAKARSGSWREELLVRQEILTRSYLLLKKCVAGDPAVKNYCELEAFKKTAAVMTPELLGRIGEATARHRNRLSRDYTLRNLVRVKDFRVLLALRYVRKLAEHLGVESPLEEVLSFPLGTNVISLAELAKVYQSAGTGRFFGASAAAPTGRLALIQEIQNAEGETIYRLEMEEWPAVEKELAAPWREILHAVVREGTGRRIDRHLVLRSSEIERDAYLKRREIRVPAYGKTGTAQDYRNATFAGLLPAFSDDPLEQGLTMRVAYTIAAYVGYDDNRPMRTPGGTPVAGAVGALPSWLETAQAVVRTKSYELLVDPFDLEYVRTRRLRRPLPEGARGVAVDSVTGLPLVPPRTDDPTVFDAENIPYVAAPGTAESYGFEPQRYFLPLRFPRPVVETDDFNDAAP